MNPIVKNLKDNNINVVEIKNQKMLNVIQSRKGEMVYVQDEDKFYRYNGTVWEEYSGPMPSFSMTQYEINKMLIKQLDFLTEKEKEEKSKLISDWQRKQKAHYYMLLGKENSYYTVFRVVKDKIYRLADGVFDCLSNVGDIYSVEEVSDESGIEIWVKYDDEPTVMYLFPYDQGIVTIGEYV